MADAVALWHPTLRALGWTASVAFDPSQELLWTGAASTGRVEALFTGNLSRYTAYRAHLPRGRAGPARGTDIARPGATDTSGADIKQLLVDDRGVFALGQHGLHCANRRGLAAWSVPCVAARA